MDAVSLIVTALASGAAEVIGDPTAVPEVWDRLSAELAKVGVSGVQVATAQALM